MQEYNSNSGGIDVRQAEGIGLISKVYGIVSTRLLISLIFIIAGMFLDLRKISTAEHNILITLYVISFAALITTTILICCCYSKSFPAIIFV